MMGDPVSFKSWSNDLDDLGVPPWLWKPSNPCSGQRQGAKTAEVLAGCLRAKPGSGTLCVPQARGNVAMQLETLTRTDLAGSKGPLQWLFAQTKGKSNQTYLKIRYMMSYIIYIYMWHVGSAYLWLLVKGSWSKVCLKPIAVDVSSKLVCSYLLNPSISTIHVYSYILHHVTVL